MSRISVEFSKYFAEDKIGFSRWGGGGDGDFIKNLNKKTKTKFLTKDKIIFFNLKF